MKKQIFNIVVKESEDILGGHLMTTEPMTEKQAMVLCQKIGREFLQNNQFDRYSLDVCTEDGEMVMLVESDRFRRGNWESTDYKVWDYRTDTYMLDTAAARSMKREAKYREDMAKIAKTKDALELAKVPAAEEPKPEEVKEEKTEKVNASKNNKKNKSVKGAKNGKN